MSEKPGSSVSRAVMQFLVGIGGVILLAVAAGAAHGKGEPLSSPGVLIPGVTGALVVVGAFWYFRRRR